jgi:thiol-disulfide isomerase/thioredoxin
MNYKMLRIFILLVLLFLTVAGCKGSSPDTTPVPATEVLAKPSATIEYAPISTLKPATTAPASVDYQWAEESPAPDTFSVIHIEPGPAKVKEILRAEAQKAAALSRQPYVEFYADWCPPCNAIRDSLGDPRMVEAFAGTYIIKLDTDDWGEKLSGTGLYVPAIPAFYELDSQGKPTGRMITGAAWGEDVPANIAPPMKAFFEGK